MIFKLEETFIDRYKNISPPWGYNGLGYFVYKRTYARIKPDNSTEEWHETCRRVVEGTFSIQKEHCLKNRLTWDEKRAKKTAQDMYDRMFNFKFLPPGRGLWAMGTEVVKRTGACLNNCAFISTKNLNVDQFAFLMDMSMLGVGVGFDTKGANSQLIKKPSDEKIHFQIPDTREGWVESVRLLMSAYLNGAHTPIFDYSLIRQEGEPIKTFGGTASGPRPLIELHESINNLLSERINQPISSVDIVDIMNLIGKCVVAGNVRRSSEIALGEAEDHDFLTMKQDHEKLTSHRWGSNNSVFAHVGMDYSNVASHTAINGEPGYFWLDNAREFGRMNGAKDFKDMAAQGCNPCQPEFATILTPDGIRQFKDIDNGSIIWSGKRWTKVINKWSTGIKKVYEYRTSAGSFIGTDNHRVLEFGDKKEVKFCNSIDTAQGEMINNYADFNPISVMDGLVIGDGSVHKASNNLVILYIGNNDLDYFNSEIVSLIKENKPGIDSLAYKINTTISHEELDKTFNRSIPDRYRFGSRQDIVAFLRGLYSANGSVVSNRVVLKATSFKIISQVQEMLSSIGIKSYYTTNKSHENEFHNGVYTMKDSYDLSINTDKDLFYKYIGFIQSYKNDKLLSVLDQITKERAKTTYDIRDRIDLGEHEVFDITVDDEDHTYWTGGLLVSNCSEQTLESGELCCLVETFPAKHDSEEDYLATLKVAYLYAKTVTLVPTHWEMTNNIINRNRRIGCSMSGIVNAFKKFGRRRFFYLCQSGYDRVQKLDAIYSAWFGVPKSIKTTSVKPSGTTSLLAGETPGIHYPHSKYYIRRVRISRLSPLVSWAKQSGFNVFPAIGQEQDTVVIEFPVEEINFERSKDDVSIWEQVANVVKVQQYWADNQVSITVTFKKHEVDDIKHVLECFEDSIKSISFLPLEEHGYVQAPYEKITQEQYNTLKNKINIKTINNVSLDDKQLDRFCDGDKCTMKG